MSMNVNGVNGIEQLKQTQGINSLFNKGKIGNINFTNFDNTVKNQDTAFNTLNGFAQNGNGKITKEGFGPWAQEYVNLNFAE